MTVRIWIQLQTVQPKSTGELLQFGFGLPKTWGKGRQYCSWGEISHCTGNMKIEIGKHCSLTLIHSGGSVIKTRLFLLLFCFSKHVWMNQWTYNEKEKQVRNGKKPLERVWDLVLSWGREGRRYRRPQVKNWWTINTTDKNGVVHVSLDSAGDHYLK